MPSAKVEARIATQLKKYCTQLEQAKQRDVNESDTCSIIRDMLFDVLGYDKNLEVTSEHNIRNSFVDLAVQCEGKINFLIEAKAIGITLRDAHVKQAIDYAANKGTSWVILTNGAVWRLYNVVFSQPIDKLLACEIDILALGPKDADVIELFGNLSREGFAQKTMAEFLERKEMASKFVIAAMLQTEAMIDSLRKEIRRLSGVRLDPDYLRQAIVAEVIKRELIDSDEGKQAQATVKKYQKAQNRKQRDASTEDAIAISVQANAASQSTATVPTPTQTT